MDSVIQNKQLLNRRLTPSMIESLKLCYHAEFVDKVLPEASTIKSVKGLFQRGLIITKLFQSNGGKYYFGISLTTLGKDVLRSCNEVQT